jgi:hypothetical protein
MSTLPSPEVLFMWKKGGYAVNYPLDDSVYKRIKQRESLPGHRTRRGSYPD